MNRLKKYLFAPYRKLYAGHFHDNNGKPVECWKTRTRWDDISRVALIVIGAAIAGLLLAQGLILVATLLICG